MTKKSSKQSKKRREISFSFFVPSGKFEEITKPDTSNMVGTLYNLVKSDLDYRRELLVAAGIEVKTFYTFADDIKEPKLRISSGNQPGYDKDGLSAIIKETFNYCNGQVLSQRFPGYFFARVSAPQEFKTLLRKVQKSLRAKVMQHYSSEHYC